MYSSSSHQHREVADTVFNIPADRDWFRECLLEGDRSEGRHQLYQVFFSLPVNI